MSTVETVVEIMKACRQRSTVRSICEHIEVDQVTVRKYLREMEANGLLLEVPGEREPSATTGHVTGKVPATYLLAPQWGGQTGAPQ